MTHPDDSVKYRHERNYLPGGYKEMSYILALVYEPKCGGREGVPGSQPMSTAVRRSPNKLTPYITYASYD
jgi:hypothetical protein